LNKLVLKVMRFFHPDRMVLQIVTAASMNRGFQIGLTPRIVLKKPLPVAIFPNQFDRRIAAQRSCFTVHGLKKDSIDDLFPRTQKLLAKDRDTRYAVGNVFGRSRRKFRR